MNHLNLTMKDGTLISTSEGSPFVAKLKGHGTCNAIRATREGEEEKAVLWFGEGGGGLVNPSE